MANTRTTPRPPRLPEIPEFENVRLDDEDVWRATHIGSEREANGISWAELCEHASIIRIIEGLKRGLG